MFYCNYKPKKIWFLLQASLNPSLNVFLLEGSNEHVNNFKYESNSLPFDLNRIFRKTEMTR